MKLKYFLLVLGILLMLIVAGCSTTSKAEKEKRKEENRKLPDTPAYKIWKYMCYEVKQV